ncbi:MAG TPA: hypothetical protein VE871_02885 [Longimicrobium sp.]|nr:hypothetical protein [Longimicrobium sp.]
MGKIRLATEELRVESFEAGGLDEHAGTVRAHDAGGTIRDSCYGRTCDTVICACNVSDYSDCAGCARGV